MKFDKKTAAAVARLKRESPLVALQLEHEGLRVACDILRAKLADLKKRIRLARKEFDAMLSGQTRDTWVEEELALERLLDLRRPLRAKGKR